jgi:hypothetical protein
VQQQREAASRLFDSNGEANRVRNKQNRAIIADGPVRVPVILPKAVTTTDTNEFSVKSADYSVNNDFDPRADIEADAEETPAPPLF